MAMEPLLSEAQWIFDKEQIDKSDLIKPDGYLVSEITKPLEGLSSVRDLEPKEFTTMAARMQKLN